MKASPGWFAKTKAGIKGVSEETTTGVNRLYQMEKVAATRSATDKAITAPSAYRGASVP